MENVVPSWLLRVLLADWVTNLQDFIIRKYELILELIQSNKPIAQRLGLQTLDRNQTIDNKSHLKIL